MQAGPPLMRNTWQVWLTLPISLQLASVNVGVSAGVAVEGDPKTL